MRKFIPVVAALSLVAMPVAMADAKRGGERPGAENRKGGEDRSGERRSAERRSSERRSRSRRCRRPSRPGFVVRGSLAGHDAESVTLDVQRANKHARRWLRENDPTFDTSDARIGFEGVTDATGEGEVDFADVVATDRVRVIGKLAVPKRGCEGDTTLRVRKVVVTREVEEDETEGESQE